MSVQDQRKALNRVMEAWRGLRANALAGARRDDQPPADQPVIAPQPAAQRPAGTPPR